jgi:hypothetical protein
MSISPDVCIERGRVVTLVYEQTAALFSAEPAFASEREEI